MQLVSFINSIIPICTWTRVTIHNCIWRTPLAVIPHANPFFTYLAPSSCDRNRPLQSQVARKLTPFVPHWPLVPSLPKSQPLLDFPGLNVHPIRATSQTQPLVYSTSGSKPEEKFKFIDKIIIGTKVCRLGVVALHSRNWDLISSLSIPLHVYYMSSGNSITLVTQSAISSYYLQHCNLKHYSTCWMALLLISTVYVPS